MSAFAHFLHLFAPTRSNNFRSRLLQPIGLFTLVVGLLVFRYLGQSYLQTNSQILGYAANIPAQEVVRITNEKRSAAGLSELRINSLLTDAARSKGEHMLENDYWAHVAPDGTEPWAFFADYGYKYRYAGENLARDFSNPQAVVEAWMASPSHRDNLMSPKYVEIGIAVVEGDLNGVDTTLVVQLFGTPMTSQPQVTTNEEVDTAPAVASEVTIVEEEQVTVPENQQTLNQDNQPIISQSEVSPLEIGRVSSMVIVGLLFILLLVDIIVIRYHRLPRNGGRPLAHISFFGIVFIIIVVAKAGSII